MAEMMDGIWELAEVIDKAASKNVTNNATLQATVTRVDNEGTAWVHIPGGAEETPINGLNTAEVQPGDVVGVSIAGNQASITGNATAPAASQRTIQAAVAPVKRQAEEAKKQAEIAEKIASEVEAVSGDTNNHFWDDSNGAHVTDVEKDEWLAAVEDGFTDYNEETKPYRNVLVGRLGILLRSCLNNLVGITRSAISFFDGQGNEASNIVARFGVDGVRVGKINQAAMDISEGETTFFDIDGADVGQIAQGNVATKNTTYDLADTTVAWKGNAEEPGDYEGRGLVIKGEGHYEFELPHAPTFGTYAASLYFGPYHNGADYLPRAFVKELKPIVFDGYGASSVNVYDRYSSGASTVCGTVTFALTATDAGAKLTIDAARTGQFNTITSLNLQIANPQLTVYIQGASPTYRFGVGETDGDFAFSTGNGNAYGDYSFAAGIGNETAGQGQAAFGMYGTAGDYNENVFFVGNGTSTDSLSNAFAVTYDGTAFAGGLPVIVRGTDGYLYYDDGN